MSKTEEKEIKIIINGEEYSGDKITPEILMGAIQALKLQVETDMNKRFTKMATKMNQLEGHLNLVDEAVQGHETSIQGFNQNFATLQEMMTKPMEQQEGVNNEKE